MSAVATSIPGYIAVSACGAMAVFYVAVLYAPTVLLRMSTPVSREKFFLRRFACAAVSTVVSVAATFYLQRLGEFEGVSAMLRVFGLRSDHLWEAVVIPLALTSLVYMGSLVCKLEEHSNSNGSGLISCMKKLPEGMSRCARNVMSWRNYVVAPITEEVVFRACMVPLLLCAGFRTSTIIFLCPMFFSLAHLNHFIELYYQGGHSFSRALLVVGFQLGYTVVFGWYAAFLFIRTVPVQLANPIPDSPDCKGDYHGRMPCIISLIQLIWKFGSTYRSSYLLQLYGISYFSFLPLPRIGEDSILCWWCRLLHALIPCYQT